MLDKFALCLIKTFLKKMNIRLLLIIVLICSGPSIMAQTLEHSDSLKRITQEIKRFEQLMKSGKEISFNY